MFTFVILLISQRLLLFLNLDCWLLKDYCIDPAGPMISLWYQLCSQEMISLKLSCPMWYSQRVLRTGLNGGFVLFYNLFFLQMYERRSCGLLSFRHLEIKVWKWHSQNYNLVWWLQFRSLLWEHRHSITYSIIGDIPTETWYCFPFLTSSAYRIWFKSTHWRKLCQLDLFNSHVVKIKESPKQSISLLLFYLQVLFSVLFRLSQLLCT